ncbi:hypothetical protein HZI73_00595 [Vallitalea pronyensis]|uniref:Fibronectin type-III domain-containing protein n=1 Tax=Vallitalea pronyensis TaxID=1348613 RepID=A0A8J8MG81_9FIRM|nr:hypothetical protein [Vallitalea pronyensis]QUI20896.1 hypothetical protein HZI73_00595 [Vallitalea pronyensis]
MNIHKMIKRILLMLTLICVLKVNVQASNLPYVTNAYIDSLVNSVKINIKYTYNNPTSFLIKRAETKDGNYVTIADNVTETTYTDTGLENAKTYYYKIYGINDSGMGTEAYFVEGIPSASNYIWFDIHGIKANLYGIDIYDEDDNKLHYTKHFIRDDTGAAWNVQNMDYADRLLNHGIYIFNVNTPWNKNYIPKTRMGIKVQPHKGIKKITIITETNVPIQADVYETIEENLTDENPFATLKFKKSGQLKENEILKSGLNAEGQDEKITITWNISDSMDKYTIMRAESKEGPYTIVATDIVLNKYIDGSVNNKKLYYYRVEGIKQDGTIVNLGTVYAKTTKHRFLIMDLFGSYDTYNTLINELQILDKNSQPISYGSIEKGSIWFYGNYRTDPYSSYATNYSLFDKAQDGVADVDHYTNASYLGYSLGEDKWMRHVLELEDNIGVNQINFWAGKLNQPSMMTFYIAESYDYNDNMILRRNDNLAYFGQHAIADVDQVTKYEFTQSPPDTPQNINAIPKDTRAKIVWDKVNNADTYNIKRSTSPNGPYTTIAQNILETEYEDTGMTNGIAYYYVVTAVNDGGESPNSAEVAITPNPQLPQAPMNLIITPRDNAIELTWQPIYNADNYKVMRSETEGGPYVSVLDSTTNTTFTDTNVVFGKTYYYVVQAKNTTGTSNNSAEAQGVPGQVLPSTPTNIITKVKDKSVHLTWDAANDATGYNLMQSKSESGPYILIHEQLRGISCNDSDVVYGETYYYKILAVNERGESEPTQPIRVHVMDTTEQKVLLSLTMKHGTTKDYILTQSQLADFMKWYQDKTQNIGLPYFTVMGKNNYGAYKAHKSYILFDAILSMDIKEIQDK